MWVRFTAGTGIQNETKTRNKCCAGGTSVIVRKEESSKHTLRVALMFRWDQSPLLKGHTQGKFCPRCTFALYREYFRMPQVPLLVHPELPGRWPDTAAPVWGAGGQQELVLWQFCLCYLYAKGKSVYNPWNIFFFSRAIHKSLMKLHLG